MKYPIEEDELETVLNRMGELMETADAEEQDEEPADEPAASRWRRPRQRTPPRFRKSRCHRQAAKHSSPGSGAVAKGCRWAAARLTVGGSWEFVVFVGDSRRPVCRALAWGPRRPVARTLARDTWRPGVGARCVVGEPASRIVLVIVEADRPVGEGRPAPGRAAATEPSSRSPQARQLHAARRPRGRKDAHRRTRVRPHDRAACRQSDACARGSESAPSTERETWLDDQPSKGPLEAAAQAMS